MSIGKYKALLAAVDTGSITKAAVRLNYTQSGISRMIAELESELGVTLLERGHGGVYPTGDGESLIPHIRRLCAEHDKLISHADELRGLQSGTIRIGTFSSVATHRLPGIIKKFRSDYPGIDYELLLGDYTEIEEWIRTGRVDCGFLRLPAADGLETMFLEDDELMAVIPKGHRLAECESFPVAELCTEPFMLLEKGAKAEISEIFERHGLTPDVHFTTWDDYAVMSMVESGLGISILPELILRRISYNIVAKPLNPPAYRRIGFAVRSFRDASLAVKRFYEYLRIDE